MFDIAKEGCVEKEDINCPGSEDEFIFLLHPSKGGRKSSKGGGAERNSGGGAPVLAKADTVRRVRQEGFYGIEAVMAANADVVKRLGNLESSQKDVVAALAAISSKLDKLSPSAWRRVYSKTKGSYFYFNTDDCQVSQSYHVTFVPVMNSDVSDNPNLSQFYVLKYANSIHSLLGGGGPSNHGAMQVKGALCGD